MHSRRSFLGLLAGAACSVLGAVYQLPTRDFDLGFNPHSARRNLAQLDKFSMILQDRLLPDIEVDMGRDDPMWSFVSESSL